MADLKFHRGTHQIGGCCTEISANGERILIDLGANLPDSDETAEIRDDALVKTSLRGKNLPQYSLLTVMEITTGFSQRYLRMYLCT